MGIIVSRLAYSKKRAISNADHDRRVMASRRVSWMSQAVVMHFGASIRRKLVSRQPQASFGEFDDIASDGETALGVVHLSRALASVRKRDQDTPVGKLLQER